MPMSDDLFLSRSGSATSPIQQGCIQACGPGESVDPKDFPTTARLTRQRTKRLPHWFLYSSWRFVSLEMRDANGRERVMPIPAFVKSSSLTTTELPQLVSVQRSAAAAPASTQLP